RDSATWRPRGARKASERLRVAVVPRIALRWSWAAACLLLAMTAIAAQGPAGYPDRPVRVIVPVAAAGGTDIIARIVLAKLAEDTGRQFVVDNRPGAGGILGNEIVAKARP